MSFAFFCVHDICKLVVDHVMGGVYRVLPDLAWPHPYTGAFDHLLPRGEADITDEEAFYATDLENEDGIQ